MTDIFLNALAFASYCWLVNASFNAFYEVKRKFFPQLLTADLPLDFGGKVPRGNRLLGESTTLGGLAVAIAIGAVASMIFPEHLLFTKALLVYLGHAAGSFIKRRLGLDRGAFLPVIDHGDYIFLTGFAMLYLGDITTPVFLISLILTLVGTPLVTMLFHRIGWRDNKL